MNGYQLFGFTLFTGGLLLTTPAQAQLSLRVLHSFSGGADGRQPYAGLVQGLDGALVGTTYQGGTHDVGVVFKVNPDGSGNTPVFSFQGSPLNPGGLVNPSGLLRGADGALYGTTGVGSGGYGNVFKINADGSGYVMLHAFDPSFGGPSSPVAGLLEANDGFLYGTTQTGGVAGRGALFKISTNGGDFAMLHPFGIGNDGQGPQSPLIQGADGALYGTTTLGGASAQGGASGLGTVFKIQTDGSGETVLHSFMPAGGDGQLPYTAGLVQGKDGTLYGTTQQGGATANGANSGFGTVFKLNPDGAGYAILHDFGTAPEDGRYPNSTLTLGTDGVLYGITEFGGRNNVGVVFRLNPDGSGYEVLYHFGSHAGDGQYPGAPLVQANDGGLFGTTKFGGDNNLGTVFRLAPAPPVITSLTPLPDKTVRLTVSGAPNYTFRIEGSSDHSHWTTLTNILNANGALQFVDYGASNAPNRFYRAAWVP